MVRICVWMILVTIALFCMRLAVHAGMTEGVPLLTPSPVASVTTEITPAEQMNRYDEQHGTVLGMNGTTILMVGLILFIVMSLTTWAFSRRRNDSP